MDAHATPAPSDILAEHAAAIRHLGTRVVENVVEIGRRLTEAKDIAGHGNWLPWLEREFGWSASTAENYINLFRLSGKFPTVGNLDLDLRTLYVLAAPGTPSEARAEIIERAEAGEPVTVAEVKTAIAKRRPEPKPKRKYKVNPAATALFANEDQLHAFAGVVNLKTVRKFVTFEQQVDLAKQLTEGNIRAAAYQSWVSDWLRRAGLMQGRIDAKERDDFYKEFPGYEIRDTVATVKSAARALVDPLLKLEGLWKKLPHNPFFGDIGSTLDDVIAMIRQYRRTAGERSADEAERDLARLHELEDKARKLEDANEGLRSELEELRGKLATGTGGAMSFPEFQTAIKKWEETDRTQRSIIACLENQNAKLRAGGGAPPADDGLDIPDLLRRDKRTEKATS
jgi:hypothetical protein